MEGEEEAVAQDEKQKRGDLHVDAVIKGRPVDFHDKLVVSERTLRGMTYLIVDPCAHPRVQIQFE